MKITENISESTIRYILSALFGFLGLLIGSLYSETIPIVLPIIIQQLPKTILLKILLVVLMLLVLSVALTFFVYLKYKRKLFPKFGVLWDKNKEAYCPSCEIVLSEYNDNERHDNPIYEFRCIKCNSYIQLMNLGKSISLLEAQKLLK